MPHFEFENIAMKRRLTVEAKTGLIPEIFSMKIKEKISNVSEDGIRPTFTIY